MSHAPSTLSPRMGRTRGHRSTAPAAIAKRVPTRARPLARRPKLPIRQALTILRVIATRDATIQELTSVVRMSRATVYRLLSGCRRDLGVRIDRESRVLKLRDWGLLNRRKVLK